MQVKELRNKTKEELHEMTKKLRKDGEEVMNSLIKGKEKNLKKMRSFRKDLARVLTVLKEKNA